MTKIGVDAASDLIDGINYAQHPLFTNNFTEKKISNI